MASRTRQTLWVYLAWLALLHLKADNDAAAQQGSGEPRAHWAFQPVRSVAPPHPQTTAWMRNPIDAFILDGLEKASLSPAPRADAAQLIRRLTLALIGRPPSPEELEAFVRDPSADAYARLVDRLLDSPQYGERWARHWLDLARYAESDGFEHDAIRPAAWRYRDYVIQSFNRDKPYDRFIAEQIAGDLLWPETPAALVATGFNLLGPDMVDSADQVQRRLNTLNDMTDTTGAVVMGLTFGCARCHDHKTEPFTQRDYYQLQAFFAPASFQRERPVPTPEEQRIYDVAMRRYDAQTGDFRRAISALEAPARQHLLDEKLSKLSEDAQLAHRTPPAQRTREQEGTVQETAPMIQVTDREVEKALAPEQLRQRKEQLAKLNRVPKPTPLPLAMVLQSSNGPSPKTFILARGDYNNPREEVAPGYPAVLCRLKKAELPADPAPAPGSPRLNRDALAKWLTRPDHPLTARVLVNRIWQHHFGRGLVATPSDFGTRGAAPSHPELLDWLAAEFIRSGWHLKQLHRLILNSSAYQQSATATPDTLARDPDNRWFSRQTRTRLEGEVIRDSLLAISGRLNGAQFGPSVFPPIPADITRTSKNWTSDPEAAAHMRRSIYIFARRNLRFPFLEAFDSPDSNLSCPERGRSTTAPQSLTLLNSDDVMEAAGATAERVRRQAPDLNSQIQYAYRLILSRPPTPKELALSRQFIKTSDQRQLDSDRTQPQPEQGKNDRNAAQPPAGLREFCRALFNLNSFVYAE